MTDDNASSLSARFSAGAETYDQHAAVQRLVADRVLELAVALPDTPANILEIGAGTGLLTRQLSRAWPSAEICALDISGAMLDVGRAKLADANVSWQVGDVAQLDGSARYDLAVSSSALHWAKPLDKAVKRLAAHLRDGAHFVCGMMVEGTLHELLASRSEVASRKMPRAALPARATVLDLLTHNGFDISFQDCADHAERFDSGRELLNSLSRRGLTGGDVSRSAGPLTRGELDALVADYESRWGDKTGRVPATYRVLYFTVRRQGA